MSSAALPLTHAIELVRPLVNGECPQLRAWLHVRRSAALTPQPGFMLALVLTRPDACCT